MDLEAKMVLARLIKTQHVAALGTINDGHPEVSMVTYLPAPDFTRVYIHISGLARHTKNIQKQPAVGVMICEGDSTGKDPQTLARLSLQGEARVLGLSEPEYAKVKTGYLEKYPDSEVSFGLGDFRLYAIELERARFVAGFGQIFNLTRQGLADVGTAYEHNAGHVY